MTTHPLRVVVSNIKLNLSHVADNFNFAPQVKYDKMHQSLYEKRRQVVTSEYEPNEEECDFPSDDETDDEKNLSKDMEEKAKIDEKEDKYVLVP